MGKNPRAASASDSLKSLSQVTEMRDHDQAALNQLKALAQRQQTLADTAATANVANEGTSVRDAAVAKSETDLKSSVEKLMQDNPDLFRDVDPEKASLQSDMQQAIDTLSSGDNENGNHYISHAAADMGDLQKAVQRNHDLQQTAEAYKLKKIIDQNIQQLGQEKNKGGSLSPQEVKDLVNSATRSTGTLKDIADQPGRRRVRAGIAAIALAGEPGGVAAGAAEARAIVAGRGEPGRGGRRAGQASQVSQAFEKSQPDLSKMNSSPGQKRRARLGLGDRDRAGRGVAGIAGADFGAAGEAARRRLTRRTRRRMRFWEISTMRCRRTSRRRAESLLAQVEDMKKKEKKDLPFPPDQLKKLLDQIQLASAEANDPDKNKADKSPITVIDSSKFPESYRDRIRAYYEQLSNHSQ